ncbi:hypothetical protein CAI21_22605, partial [Alkalilimnicola ehrlichii]
DLNQGIDELIQDKKVQQSVRSNARWHGGFVVGVLIAEGANLGFLWQNGILGNNAREFADRFAAMVGVVAALTDAREWQAGRTAVGNISSQRLLDRAATARTTAGRANAAASFVYAFLASWDARMAFYDADYDYMAANLVLASSTGLLVGALAPGLLKVLGVSPAVAALLANPWVIASLVLVTVAAAVWAYFAKNDETERWLRFSPWGKAWDWQRTWRQRNYDDPRQVLKSWAELMNPVSAVVRGGSHTCAVSVTAPSKVETQLEVRPYPASFRRRLSDGDAWLPVAVEASGDEWWADPLLLALHKVCEDTDCRPHADGSGYDWLIPAGNF